MMFETRPSGGELDGAARLLASARERLSAAASELSIPEALRLSERERTLAARIAGRLVSDVEDALRSALAASLDHAEAKAALSSAALPIALPLLREGRILSDPALLALLLRRAEEHRLSRAAAAGNALLTRLSGDADAAVAEAAVALLIAESRRLDAFQEPVLPPEDLPAEIAHGLLWAVAAALRHYLVLQHGIEAGEVDERVASAANASLSGCDEGRGVDTAAGRLALALQGSWRLEDDLLAAAALEGTLPLLLAGLALRTGLTVHNVWELLGDAAGAGPAWLLRGAGVGRDAAASILFALHPREEAASRALGRFDAASAHQAGRILLLWRLDPAFRGALARLAA